MNNIKPLVSIIIPFYNAEKYLISCINNINSQTYKNIEVIFINDGSNDNSLNILLNSNYNFFKVISQSKKGVSAARNLGIRNSNGKYIAFIDVDDCINDNYIEKFVDIMETNNVNVAICNYIEEYPNKSVKIILPWKNEIIDKSIIIKTLIPQMIYNIGNEDEIRGLVWRTFISRQFLNSINIEFKENISVAEDLLFTIQLYNKASKIYVLEECLYHYKKNNNSTLNKYRNNEIDSQKLYHKIFVEILKSENLYINNKDRYEINKLRLYTNLISNSVRNPDKNNQIKEIKAIRTEFINEKINYKKYKFSLLIRLTYFLLNINCIYLLKILYRIKEKIRIRELN